MRKQKQNHTDINYISIQYSYSQMSNKEGQKKVDLHDQDKDRANFQCCQKQEQSNPFNFNLFDLSPYSPIMRTVKKSSQFASPHYDFAIINTPVGIQREKSFIEEVDEESPQKISMVLGFEDVDEDEEDSASSSYSDEESESIHQVILVKQAEQVEAMPRKVEEEVQEKQQSNYESSLLPQKAQKRKTKQTSTPKKIICNCKKTKCLKLYCDCFRENQYCDENCNCYGCHNTEEYESERNTSILSLLERNPEAFKPKVEDSQHSKGCNCKKSGCQKKYCQCFQPGLECGQHCKCEECKNCGQSYKSRKGNGEIRTTTEKEIK